METEKTYETVVENANSNGVGEVDTESLISDIAVSPEIIDDFKSCIFCNEKIDKDVLFCSFCGKPQKPGMNNINTQKKAYEKKRVKKKIVRNTAGIVMSVFSYISFGFAVFAFFIGIYRMLFMNNITMNIFGTNSDSLIVNQTHVIGNFLISIFFLITGIFLNLKADKKRKKSVF